MNARIDKSGRIVVPKSLRERLGLKPNTEFELVERADGVLLRPVEQPPSMLKVEGLWVHQGTAVPDARLAPYSSDRCGAYPSAVDSPEERTLLDARS